MDKEKRCKDCAYLVESETGELICTSCYYKEDERPIIEIDDTECDLMYKEDI